MTQNFDGFISYSRKDEGIAERLSNRIRRYKPPKAAALEGRKLTVFRDEERLTASSDLSKELVERLDASKQLILLCSPNAAQSDWVEEEVDAFIKKKGLESIIFVLCEDELKNSLPPSLSKQAITPLYVDLRDVSNKQFRIESLRIIAALYQVDFAVLLREDDARRRRINRSTFSTVLLFLFTLFSFYLIFSTEPTYWKQIEQPEVGNTVEIIELLPVHDVAINRTDPNKVLFLGHNADWDTAAQIFFLTPGNKPDKLDSLALARLGKEKYSLRVARVDFNLCCFDDGTVGKGQVLISAILDEKSQLRYVRSMDFLRTRENQQAIKIIMKPTLLPVGENPFDLGRPMERIITKEFKFEKMDATIEDYLNNEKIETSYSDLGGTLDYGRNRTAIFGQRYRIFLNSYSKDFEVLGKKLREVQHRRTFWDTIEKSNKWEVYEDPVDRIVGYGYFDSDESDKALLELVQDMLEEGDSQTIKSLLEPKVMGVDYVYLTLITVENSYGQADLLRIEGYYLPYGHGESTSAGVDWLIRLSGSSDWQDSEGVISKDLLGLWPLDSLGKSALLLTGNKGFYKTQNGGKSWEAANYNETGFTAGNSVKPIVIDKDHIFALIDRCAARIDGPNPLFQLQNRNWIERWRTGLINLLQ